MASIEDIITRRILNYTRSMNEEARKASAERKKRHVNEEATSPKDLSSKKSYAVRKDNPKLSDVRESQESSIVKTVGEGVEFDENALMYYPDNKDLVLTGKISALNLVFQFRYNDPSGDGCYVWTSALQLTDTNNRTMGKIRNAFLNWKASLVQDGDLLSMLQRESEHQS